MIGTFVVTCEPKNERCAQTFNVLSAYYRSADKSSRGSLRSEQGSMFRDDTVYDFVDQARREKGYYFCIALPPGDYAFHTIDFYNYSGGGTGYSVREENQFNLPYSLAPGEVVYVGRLKVTTTIGQNIFGMKLKAPGALLLSNNATESAAALQKCPENVRGRTVRDASLKVAMANGNPLVQANPGQ